MIPLANGLRGRSLRIGAMLFLALSLCPCILLAQEPQTPPPPPLPPPQARTNERVAIRAGRLFDGKSDDLKKQQIILIEGARIVQVGSANDVPIPPGTDVLDLKTLGGMYGDVDLRNAINNGLVQGPRMQVSGRGFQTTGGFRPKGYSRDIQLPSMLETVDSPWEVRRGVREQLMNGADWIKFYATNDFTFAADGKMVIPVLFTFEEVQAFVEEAHDRGHKVSCHAFGGKGLHNCVAAGVDTIEHGVDLSDEDIQQFKTKGIYLIPTLYHYQLDREHDARKYGGHTVAEVSEPNFRRAVAAGVKIGFGTGVGPFPHGIQTKEFEYMVKFGMTPAQVIRAARSE